MPVTARLSRKFYDTFGDEIANEFVEWFNQVDQTYRTDLMRINELNYTRFDAKVDQRFAEAQARLDQRFAAFEAKWDQRFADLRVEVARDIASLDARLGRQITALETRLIRWVIALWLATALGILGLLQFR